MFAHFHRLLTVSASALALVGTVMGAPRYAVQDLASGEVIRRGEQASTGITAGQLILAPNSYFRVWVFDPVTRRLGYRDVFTPQAGQNFSLDGVPLRASASVDRDGDGLSDEAEMILGTSATNPDTDGDGVTDGAALDLGLDPVTGAFTGIIGAVGTPGGAIDVAARNDLAVVANSGSGITVFNIFNGMPPVLMASVDTPGNAQSVAISGDYVAVADGLSGLIAIEVSDPPAATITQQILLGAEVVAVAASNEVAYAALASGEIVVVALDSGQVLQRTFVAGALQDLAIAGDTLYALTSSALHALPLSGNLFSQAGIAAAPGSVVSRRRLHAGTERAYASHRDGYAVFSLSNQAQPSFLNDVRPGATPWRQIVPNGSGLGVAAHSTNVPVETFTHLYGLTSDGSGDSFVTSFADGSHQVRALALYNGRGYLASMNSGLEVLNYLAVDTTGLPPTISLETTAVAGVAEEGQPFRVTALVGDDVQVRNVEFYVDGARRTTDGNAPFEFRFNTPRDDGGDASFRLQARASDTGGNATWSQELVITLGPDTTAPAIIGTFPGANTIVGQTDTVTILFGEAIDPASFDPDTVFLVFAGADEVSGTLDDAILTASAMTLSPDGNRGTLTFAEELEPGVYSLEVTSSLRDLAGNAPSANSRSTFRVVGGEDPDQDGVPSDVEAALGLDPFNPDTDGDGLSDGLEDNDADGLGNAIDLALALNPGLPDTDGDGILDRDEDFDRDGAGNLSEIGQNLNPFNRDTDGDQFWDGMELEAGSDAADPGSFPILSTIATARPTVLRRSSQLPADFQLGAVIATERPKPLRRSSQLPADFQLGAVIATERPKPLRRSSQPPADFELGAVIALERVQPLRRSTDLPADFELGTVIAQPPVTVTGESP